MADTLPKSEKGATATMINPTTGHKVAVVGGGALSHQLFGQGYFLMGKNGEAVGYKPPSGGAAGSDANSLVNANQESDFASFLDSPTVRQLFGSAPGSADSGKVPFFAGIGTMPTAPNFTDLYKQLTGGKSDTNPFGLGITDLETQAADLAKQERAIQQQQRDRNAYAEGRPVALGVISGQESEIDRQTRTQLDSIAIQKQAVNDQLNTKYNTLNTIMKLTQQDYDNAKAQYDTKFSQAMDAINLVRGLRKDYLDEAQQKRDNAQANLTVIYNSIKDGNVDFNTLDTATKNNIANLEMQAGLPVGFVKKLHDSNPKADIISTTSRQEQNGDTYSDVLMRDKATGKITVQHVFMGKTKVTKSTTNSPTNNPPNTESAPGSVNKGGGYYKSDSVGGLSFFDKANNPITAAQYAANTKGNLITILQKSKAGGDAELIKVIQSVADQVNTGKVTAEKALADAQSAYDYVFNGVSLAQFKSMLGLKPPAQKKQSSGF